LPRAPSSQELGNGHVGLDNPGIQIRGARMWPTVLKGPKACSAATASARCLFGDFASVGEARARAAGSQGVHDAFAGRDG
jgi:hypothetical protein